MHWIDWSIIATFFACLLSIAGFSRRYTSSVADFLVANRCAGRYLLTVADASAGIGTMFIIGNFEKYYHGGFAVGWWGNMLAPIYLILAMTGFIVYRYRETRAMTMGQFFEMRYSRRFRIFAGALAWTSGVVAYGVVPAVTARFFIYFCNLPVYYVHLGGWQINLTVGIVMLFLLGVAVTFTLTGGQITVMITDFFQGQFMNIALIVMFAVLMLQVSWSEITHTLTSQPPGRSLVNPFDQAEVSDFNFGFYAMLAVLAVYGYMATPVANGFYGAARTPHEAKMARMLAMWRYAVAYLLVIMMPIVAHVILNGKSSPGIAQQVRAALLEVQDPQIREQLTVPLTMTHVLPMGVVGLFAAVMVAAAVATDATFLHSWGSVFVQDVLLPMRRRPLDPAQHLRWLRRSILGVAVFAWCFSMVFPLREYLFMFSAITGAIFVGGAGAVVIGGLYWKRGTTTGAWAAMIAGSFLAIAGILLNNVFWPHLLPGLKLSYPDWSWLQALPEKSLLNGMHLSVITAACAASMYVITSLATRPDPQFSMDRLLHRGEFAETGSKVAEAPPRGWRVLAMGSNFTTMDKLTYWLYLGWTLLMVGWFVVFSCINLAYKVSDQAWLRWWWIYLCLGFTMGIMTTVWFLWGGTKDLLSLFRALKLARRNATDDGTVQHADTKDAEKVSCLQE
jgi:SSS family solute:Na+ symporter